MSKEIWRHGNKAVKYWMLSRNLRERCVGIAADVIISNTFSLLNSNFIGYDNCMKIPFVRMNIDHQPAANKC